MVGGSGEGREEVEDLGLGLGLGLGGIHRGVASWPRVILKKWERSTKYQDSNIIFLYFYLLLKAGTE